MSDIKTVFRDIGGIFNIIGIISLVTLIIPIYFREYQPHTSKIYWRKANGICKEIYSRNLRDGSLSHMYSSPKSLAMGDFPRIRRQ